MPNKYYRRIGTYTASPKLASGLESITPRQSVYAADLAKKLGYANVTQMWHEYGFIERTMGGDKSVTPSKVAAARVISELVERAKLINDELPESE